MLRLLARHWVALGRMEQEAVGEVVPHVRPVLVLHLMQRSMVAPLVLGLVLDLEQGRLELVLLGVLQVLEVLEVVAVWVLLDTERSILSSFGRQQSDRDKVCSIRKNKTERNWLDSWRGTS